MKRILMTALAMSLMAGTAMAASVPVTKVNSGDMKVQAEYSFAQKASNRPHSSGNDGFGVSMQAGLSDKWAAQYGYSKVNLSNSNLKDHQLAAVYKVHDNVNLYGAGTYVDTLGHHDFGYQAGVIGHMDVTDRLNGYAKLGFGDDIKQSMQLGGSYALVPNVDLNVYYQYDKYDVNSNKTNVKGLHAGVGYSF